MSMHFRDLAEQAAADGAISPDEIVALRRAGWSDGRIQPEEAEAIFAINGHIAAPTIEWSDFFVEALSEFVVNGSEPRGYVSEALSDWLIAQIDRDRKLDSMTELELLAKVLDKATNAPDKLKSYALAQIERAVLDGVGPTRDGGALEARRISEAETRLLRRILFAQASERPAAVSHGEAELLFRLKDATLGAENAPEWKRLFVQGVGNYLQGFGSYTPLSSERAAELEAFMDRAESGVGRFFARMARANLGQGAQHILAHKPARNRDAEAAAAHEVSGDEQRWLQGRIDADGRLDEFEQALLDFLAEA